MRLLQAAVAIATALIASNAIQFASAELAFMQEIPNAGLVKRNGVAWPAVGHLAPTTEGGGENVFGDDYDDRTWGQLCALDSDGDGFTNGMELGDPDCVWAKGQTPSRLCDISHPGYADSTPAGGTCPPPPPPAPTLAAMPGATAVQSETFTVMGGKMTYSYTFSSLDTAPMFDLTMTSNGNHYVAFGVAPQLMDGPMICCHVANNAGQCAIYDGQGVAATKRADQSSVAILAATSNGGAGYTITIRTAPNNLNIQNADIKMIHAVGPWDSAAQTAGTHGATTNDRGGVTRNPFAVVSLPAGQTLAPATTTAAPPTPAPTLAPTLPPSDGASATLSQTFSVLGGKMSYSWTITGFTKAEGPDLELTMTAANGNHYVSFGVSPKQMDGPMICCHVQETAGQCALYDGQGITATKSATQPQTILSASSSASGYTIRVRLPAKTMNVQNAIVRTIHAVGPWNSADQTAGTHGTSPQSDRNEQQHNLYGVVTLGGGKTLAPVTAAPTTAAPSTLAPTAVPTLAAGQGIESASVGAARLQFGGRMSYSWTFSNLQDPQNVDFDLTLTSTGDWYASFGTGPQLMDGPMIACYVAPGAQPSSSAAQCSFYDGQGITATKRSVAPHTILSANSTSGGGFTVTVRMPASSMNIFNGAQRVMTATGPYNAAANEAVSHGTTSSDRTSEKVNLFSVIKLAGGATLPPETAAPLTAPPTLPPIVVAASARQAASPAYSVVGGKMSFDWKFFNAFTETAATERAFQQEQQASSSSSFTPTTTSPQQRQSTADGVIELTMGTTGDRYVSFGTAPDLMNGPMVACYVDPSDSTPHCSDWDGEGLDIRLPKNGPWTRIVSSTAGPSGGYTVTVRMFAKSLAVARGQWQRAMVATGQYSVAGRTPLLHTTSDRDAFPINIETGEARTAPTEKGFWIAAGITIGCGVALLVAGAALNFARLVVGPLASKAMYAAVMLLFFALLAVFFALTMTDHKRNLKGSPLSLALGDACLFCFWFVLWPVPRHVVSPAGLVGTSFERLISYHAAIGVTLMLVATAHFIAIAVSHFQNPSTQIFEMKGKHPALAGFIAWLFLVVICITSLARRWFYGVFQLFHLLFIPAIVFSVMHYPKLVFALIPPLLNYGLDWVLRTASWALYQPTVLSATRTAEDDVVHLKLQLGRLAAAPHAGGFVKIAFPPHPLLLNPHPFSICHYDDESRECHILVKVTGGTWTTDLHAKVASRAITAGSHLLWHGVYGSLQVPLGKIPNLMLVGGGIGITPLIHIAGRVAQMAREKKEKNGEAAIAVQSVTFVWSTRDPGLIDELLPLIRKAFAPLVGETRANVLIFDTSSNATHRKTNAACIFPPTVMANNNDDDRDDNNNNTNRSPLGYGGRPTRRNPIAEATSASPYNCGQRPAGLATQENHFGGRLTQPIDEPSATVGTNNGGLLVLPQMEAGDPFYLSDDDRSGPSSARRFGGGQRERLDEYRACAAQQKTTAVSRRPSSANAREQQQGRRAPHTHQISRSEPHRRDGGNSPHASSLASVSAVPSIAIRSGRPDVAAIASDFYADDEPVAFYSCGPAPLMAAVRDLATERKFSYLHEELFDF